MGKAPGGVGSTTAPGAFRLPTFYPLASDSVFLVGKFYLCQRENPFGEIRPLKNVTPSTETFLDKRMLMVHVRNGGFL
jgi:hypothetical protein